MKKLQLTVKEFVFVKRSCEDVWDYTQNYDNRTDWDLSISSVEVLQEVPRKKVRVKTSNGGEIDFEYKLNNRPRQTSLAITNSSLPLIIGGGGSWDYQAQDDGTLWTQTNTIIFKPIWWLRLIKPLLIKAFQKATQVSMLKAKKIMENS